MNYAELKTTFENRLKRRDLSASASGEYIQLGLRRLYRTLRIHPMEASETTTIDGTFDPQVGIAVPNGLLQLKSIRAYYNGENYPTLVRKSYDDVLARLNETGIPSVFERYGENYLVAPVPLEDFQLTVEYYGPLNTLSEFSDENWLSINAPDLVVYSALVYAADDFLDRRGQGWAQSYKDLLAELQTQADGDMLTSSAMSPAYRYDEDNE